MTTYTIKGKLPYVDDFVELASCRYMAIANLIQSALETAYPQSCFKIAQSADRKGESA